MSSDKRLADTIISEPKTASFFIEKQFPGIYRENGRELIEIVKAYYKFLETQSNQSVFNIRRIYEYRNIDTTLNDMLIFFKTKFLNGIFFDEDVRFVVKNILDLYRRKGSKEGIELFFRLFFESEVEIYYPSQDIFKPSQSSWKVGQFIQLFSTTNINLFDDLVNRRIFGDISNASAFVDNVYFINLRRAYVPVLFISDAKGEFVGFDTVYSIDPLFTYGRVYGSLRNVRIEQVGSGTGDNKVGDVVDIKSSVGFGAKGRVTKVTEQLSGEIQFNIEDGNYGYTTSNTSILISDQVVFFANEASKDFNVNERIKQVKTFANTAVFGTVVGKSNDAIGVYLDYSQIVSQNLIIDTTGSEYNTNEQIRQVNSYGVEVFGNILSESEGEVGVQLDHSLSVAASKERYFFERNFAIVTTNRMNNISKQVISVQDDYFIENSIPIETTSRDVNISRLPLFNTSRNTTARANINNIDNTETITIVTDIIENYLNVPLNSSDYSTVPPALLEMSGTRVNSIVPSLNTPLNQAFVPETFTIGRIRSLRDVNPGFDYASDAFILAKENLLSRFNLQDQILNVSAPVGVVLFEGNVINQTRQIQMFDGSTTQKTIIGLIKRVVGNDIFVKQRTFESFVADEPIFKQNSSIPITVNTRSRDLTSVPLGLNAVIRGEVEVVAGKIQEIEVFDSGIGYENEIEVEIVNVEKENNQGIDAFGIAESRRQGITEGRWKSFESHTNQEKVIQDSLFYQDYSYEIKTDIETTLFLDKYIDLMHPAGIKLFSSFTKKDIIDVDIEIFDRVSILSIENVDLISEDFSFVIGENGFQYLNTLLIEE
jgi:hypothetical protein